MIIGSPFNYRKQALLYLDRELPVPDRANNEIFQQKSVEVIERLINASNGRSLVLFTSYSHLRFVSENIKTDYPFKSQGEMPPARLIKWFRMTGNPDFLLLHFLGIDIKEMTLAL
jgi:ATP-dependent DNA helicase DinG